jgi:hypothetical protein
MKKNDRPSARYRRWICRALALLVILFAASLADAQVDPQEEGTAGAGANCTASGGDAMCRGFGSEALGNTSTAIGIQNVACVDQTAAYGLRTWAETPRAFVVGQYNMRATTDQSCEPYTIAGQEPLFVVGAGLGPGNPFSEQNRNALTVLGNGTTVVGLVRSPETNVGPLSTLNVVGNAYVDRDLSIGDGLLSIGRGSPTGFRDLSLWVAVSFNGTSCASSCGSGVCLVAYADRDAVEKVSCGATFPNRNCLCAGRP